MFDSKRPATIGRQVALIGATLLLLLLSVSTGRASEFGGRLGAQVLRQAMGFRAHSLRPSPNPQTRASRLEHSDTRWKTVPASDGVSTFACLYARQPLASPAYRLVDTYGRPDIETLEQLIDFEFERARAPPSARTARSNSQNTHAPLIGVSSFALADSSLALAG